MKKKLFLLLLMLCAAAPGKAISLVTAKTTNASAATAVTVTIGITSGDLAVIGCAQDTNTTSTLAVTDSASQSGWTQIGGYVKIGTGELGVFMRPNSAGLSSITGTWSGSLSATLTCQALDISGAGSSTPLDSNASNPATSSGSGNVASLASGSLSTSNANDLLVYMIGFGSSNPTSFSCTASFTVPSGGSAANGRMAVCTLVVSATQSSTTTTMSWTSAATDRVGSLFAIANTNQGAAVTGANKVRRYELADDPQRMK